MKNTLTLIASLLAGMALLSSCSSSKNIAYFQDLEVGSEEVLAPSRQIRLRPGDKISIIVNCREPQLAAMFNLAYATRYVGAVNDMINSASQSAGVQGYMVNDEGDIDFPVVGMLHVEGLTRDDVARLVKTKLSEQELLKDAVVTVEYLNLKVSVLGEVMRPGRIAIDRDEYTILDALSAAGDLTIYGKRECVKVTRTVDGVRKTYAVNLCSAKDVLSSEAFFLQQNDVVYVEPNEVRARQSSVNGNNVRSTSFWMSVASLAVTISYYFFLFNR